MRKYLIGKHNVWLRAKPQDITHCWPRLPGDGQHSVYDLDVILVYEDDEIIKALPAKPFVDKWMETPKGLDVSVWPQFIKMLKEYIKENLK